MSSDRGSKDAVIIGSGPNGLAAAIEMARLGRSTLVIEGAETIGGGLRTKELTLPGFMHDVCSAIHPLGLASPFFQTLPLHLFGLRWIQPPVPLAHPLDDGTAVVIDRSIDLTAANLGPDGGAYRRLLTPFVRRSARLIPLILSPLRIPDDPLIFARFGMAGAQPAAWFARRVFKDERARAVFAGMSAHAMLPLDRVMTTAFGLTLNILAHAVGWPLAAGGSQRIAEAMEAYLRSLGGEIETGRWIHSMNDIPPAKRILFDVTPAQMLEIAGDCFTPGYRSEIKNYRYGVGVFKVDYALDGPVPWKAVECTRAGSVHLGGTLPEIENSERAVWQGVPPEHPFVIAAQQSLFDPTRAPEGKHTLWAYCHVPGESTADMTERIENQIERFAPGFRSRILARHTVSAAEMEVYNPNYVGGDINGGVQDWRQLFTRPSLRLDPYSTPSKKIFLCSSSTPPGGGVHGMCGYYAAQSALKCTMDSADDHCL